MRRFLGGLPRRLFLVGMLLGSALMTWVSLSYFDFDTLPAFLLEKLPLRFERFWLATLRLHVASALVALPSCLLLMTRPLQRHPRGHRWLGRVTGVLVLFLLVPTGVLLAFDAKGGLVVTLGFLLSAALVAAGVVLGVRAARGRDLVAHSRAMRHVVAQMSVAVTSRLLIVLLDAAGMQPDTAYVVALWVPVLVSAAVAELVSPGSPLRLPSSFSFERIRREMSPVAQLVPVRSRVGARARLGR